MKKILLTTISTALIIAIGCYLWFEVSLSQVVETLKSLRPSLIVVSVSACLLSVVLSGLRLWLLFRNLGYRPALGLCIESTALGGIIGSFLFSFYGSTFSRSLYLQKHGIDAEVTLMTSFLEKIGAFLSLGLLTLLFNFHRINQFEGIRGAGGAELGLLMACVIFAAIVFLATQQHQALGDWLRLYRASGSSVAISLGLSIFIHGLTFFTFYTLFRQFGEAGLIESLGTIFVILFISTLPISIGGIGVREFCSAFLFPQLGVTVLEGACIGTLAGMVAFISFALLGGRAFFKKRGDVTKAEPRSESQTFLATSSIVLLSAFLMMLLVCFQFNFEWESGAINFNLSDPLVLLTGAMGLKVLASTWKIPWLKILFTVVLLMTACLGISLLIGAVQIGYTDWAFINKGFGWLVLLCFFTSGLLFGRCMGKQYDQLITLLVIVISGISLSCFVLELLRVTGWYDSQILMRDGRYEAFAANANAFAFQLLTGLGGALWIAGKRKEPSFWLILAGGIMIWALEASQSRSGILAALILATCAIAFHRCWWRHVLGFMGGAMAFKMALFAFSLAVVQFGNFSQAIGSSSTAPISTSSVQSAVPQPGFALPEVDDPSGHELGRFGESVNPIRAEGFIAAVTYFLQSPLFGKGMGYHMVQDAKVRPGYPQQIHNTFLWWLGEMGIILSIPFFVFGFLLFRFRSGWKADGATLLLRLILIGFFVATQFNEMSYQRLLWLLVGITIGAISLEEESKAQEHCLAQNSQANSNFPQPETL